MGADEQRPAWPDPVPKGVAILFDTPRRRLNLTALDAIEKRLVWECLKRRQPALAGLLADPRLEALRGAFNGSVLMTID